jgi:tetratricopeptide (TPR) repeat protein
MRNRSYLKKRTNNLFIYIGIASAAVISVVLVFYFATRPQVPHSVVDTYYDYWEENNYQELISLTESILEDKPLHYITLTFNGFSYFYMAVSQFNLEDQIPLLDNAIAALRQALLLNKGFFDDEIHYILGKAYYQKGSYYSDLAYFHLNRALEMGIEKDDIYEYLGLSSASLNNFEGSVEYFNKALEIKTSETVLNALALAYYNIEDFSNAERVLSQNLNRTSDSTNSLKSWELLGQIYRDTNKLQEAETVYNTIIELNPESADAHYYLGEIYFAQDNLVKARSEWREALRIDSTHNGARLRYYRN